MGHYIQLNKYDFPLCWEWAFKNMDKSETITGALMIEFHTRNKRKCPFCLDYKTGKPKIDLNKVKDEPFEQVFNTLWG